MNAVVSRLISMALAGSLLVHAGYASAEDDSLEALLSESIESTSGKAAGSVDSAPALSLSVTAEELRRYGIRNLAEAYKFLTLGLSSEDPLGDPEVGARGVFFPADLGKHVLLLLNGHTLNNQQSGASFHGQALGVPIEMIDHVEVALGPGSVLYGANAMFGVINVITKRAKDFPGFRLIAEASFSPPLDRDHDPLGPGERSHYLDHLGHTYRIVGGAGYELTLAGVPAEVTAGVQYYTLAGPSMTWGPESAPQTDFGPRGTFGVYGGVTSASYYEHTASAYARLLVGELEGSVQAVSSRVSSPYVRVTDRPLDATDFDDPDSYRDRRQLALELKWRSNVSHVVALAARVYADLSTESFRLHQHAYFGCFAPFVPLSYRRCEQGSFGHARWMGSELQAHFDWLHDLRLVSTLGADARVRHVGYENDLEELDTGKLEQFSDVHRDEQAAAVYAQQVYRPAPWLTLNAGARWDFDSDIGNRISPRGAIIYQPWHGGTIKAIYSEALRAPTMDERTYRDPRLALPSDDLRAESVRSIELIMSERFGAQSLVFGLFRSWWSNMVVREQLAYGTDTYDDPDSVILREAQQSGVLSGNLQYAYQYQNVGSIDNWGLNGGWAGSSLAGQLSYALNVTAAYTRSHTPEGTRLLTVTPSWFGNARLSYDFPERLPVLALAAHFGGKRLADVGEDAGFVPLPFAPASLDLRSTLSGPFPWIESLSYRVVVDYSFAPSAPYAAGRATNAILGRAPELIPENRLTALFGLELSL